MMEDIISYLVSLLVTIILVGSILLFKRSSSYLKTKSDNVYDEGRNEKVSVLTKLVYEHIDMAIDAFFAENNIEEINGENIEEIVLKVSAKVRTLTSEGVIKYLMSVFIDNWDDWVYEAILSRLGKSETVELD